MEVASKVVMRVGGTVPGTSTSHQTSALLPTLVALLPCRLPLPTRHISSHQSHLTPDPTFPLLKLILLPNPFPILPPLTFPAPQHPIFLTCHLSLKLTHSPTLTLPTKLHPHIPPPPFNIQFPLVLIILTAHLPRTITRLSTSSLATRLRLMHGTHSLTGRQLSPAYPSSTATFPVQTLVTTIPVPIATFSMTRPPSRPTNLFPL